MKTFKINNFLIFFLIFLTLFSIILIKPLGNLDEIWNYNFALNVANGLIPYKDFNMVIMPLLPLVCGYILKIITKQLIIMRVLAAFLCATILYVTYKLFVLLKIDKAISFGLTFYIGVFLKEYFCLDYNFVTLLLVLCIIFIEISVYKKYNSFFRKDYKNDFLLGILSGLSLTVKQSTGLIISIALLINQLLYIKNKEELKIYFKQLFFRGLGMFIPIFLIFIYLIKNDAFFECINYAISGLSQFNNYVPYTNLIGFNIVGLLSIIVPLVFVVELIKTLFFINDKITYIFLVYGLAMFIVCFPISDHIHFLIGVFPMLILILYKINDNFTKKIKNTKFFLIFQSSFLLSSISCMSICIIINVYSYFNLTNYSKLNHYNYIPILKADEKDIKSVCEYVISSDKKVIILDASAAKYMIPIERYNKNYDLLLKGNLGYGGENKIIKEINDSKNIKYFVKKEVFGLNWQTSLNIINYVKKTKIKTGYINKFDIYE